MNSERINDKSKGKSSDSDDTGSPSHASITAPKRDEAVLLPGKTKPEYGLCESPSDQSISLDTDMEDNPSDRSIQAKEEKSERKINPEPSSVLLDRPGADVEDAKYEDNDPSEASAGADEHESLPNELIAVVDGQVINLYLTVGNMNFDKETALATLTLPNGAAIPTVLGNDGNQFYCQVCKDFGDVVCCDGCPRVYHQKCIPTTDPSRQALDNDADPWYCPICMKKHKNKGPLAVTGRASERRVKRKCTECQQSGGELVPCEACGAFLHYPSCRISEEFKESPNDQSSIPFCSNCRVEAVVEEEELAFEQDNDDDDESSEARPRRLRKRSIGNSDADDESQNGDEDDDMMLSGLKRKKDDSKKKRKRPSLLDDGGGKPQLIKSKKKKKSKKRSESFASDAPPDQQSSPTQNDHNYYAHAMMPSNTGLVKAIPALFFFLNDSRSRIERVLSKKHRYFSRLPKGVERNEIIAKEGAKWWTKLRPSDQKRFVAMSMQEFEARVIQWKEEKTIKEMESDLGPDEDSDEFLEYNDGGETTPGDHLQMYHYHRRLYLGTTVGSKPFTVEPGKSNNRVLLELLQDTRFHPLPMLHANRTDGESTQPDRSKSCIPFFDVHGPVATSVGDECLGCTRGWNHHCSVLKRRIPAIEHRARLQPSLSSLLACRVGLGIKPKIPDHDEVPNEGSDAHAELFVVRETKSAKEIKLVPPIPSFTLSQPSTRVDDVVHFIEEALAMKIPEPPRPSEPTLRSESQKKSLSRGKLPFAKKSKDDSNGDGPTVGNEHDLNRCGRCRAIIRGDTGCVQCRRAQLVINMSKKFASHNASVENPPPGRSEKDSTGVLKVQTAMLGHLSAKETNFEDQSDSDKKVSAAILSMRWSPCAVLAPTKTLIPTRRRVMDNELENVFVEEFATEAGDMEVEPLDDVTATDDNYTIVNSTFDNEPGSKRQRSARLMAAATSILALSGDPEPAAPLHDRQQIAVEHKEEAKEVQNLCIRVACSGILLAMMRRDPLRLFAEPVAENIVGYSTVVKTPIDFSIIRSRVLKGKYPTLAVFLVDARLLCTNALAFNPPGSIYHKTATELLEVLVVMHERASGWMSTIKDAHASSFAWQMKSTKKRLDFDGIDGNHVDNDPFRELRKSWPEAVEMLETGDWLMEQIEADFVRTKENENAYYGTIAVQRAAAAAEASLAPYPNSGGVHNVVAKRSHIDDENLRRMINSRVTQIPSCLELKHVPTWREESIIRILRRVQSKRVEARISSENGCARCDGVQLDPEDKLAMTADAVRWGRNKKKGELDTLPRVAESRLLLTTGTASMKAREQMKESHPNRKINATDAVDNVSLCGDVEEDQWNVVNNAAVSVRGSRVHGWGLFADQPFKKGAVVAEYVGEYISNAVADAREKMYQERRIQDYQFRVDESLVIDATLKGGHGRYINHSCNPSCVAKIVDGNAPNTHLKRVIIIAQRDIDSMEEITYDYQFPLELDLEARIPCNCGSELCRGFMNWDLPEKGSKNSATRTQKRGGNMRDRIRRLGKKANKRPSLVKNTE
jgi:hypothetical protein